MPIPMWVTRVNRRVTNPLMMALSDDVPPLATLHHVGRRTGRRLRTPIFAFPTARGFVIALTYGPDVQWLRNLEAGEARLVRRRVVYRLADPVRLHGDDGARLVPAWTRAGLRPMHVDEFVELRAEPIPSPRVR
ncbi:nitroreductase family deazaflavin-dependent oxidoreductase [Cellulomonas sp. NS3]|uniref:nitroreductase family deazaflavin-dependent oxidoreductase n=1 Tax=Cellulomonas sp. NS3 TaxID=2973977 RepID=UPI00216144F8|nr:nitroreductase family deazaflavin-dependent oxidoreductase [Cellulomonas sp. NS3]